MLVNDALLLLLSFIGILTSFIYILVLFLTHDKGRQKIRSLANLLAANSCVAGFLLNITHFSDAIIMWHADINNDIQRQADSFCVLRGGLRTALNGTMYYSLW